MHYCVAQNNDGLRTSRRRRKLADKWWSGSPRTMIDGDSLCVEGAYIDIVSLIHTHTGNEDGLWQIGANKNIASSIGAQ